MPKIEIPKEALEELKKKGLIVEPSDEEKKLEETDNTTVDGE